MRAAKELEQEIPPLLAELGMTAVSFEVKIERMQQPAGQYKFGAEGIDQIEFLFSANPGHAVAPLAKIASGGEISRVMLALKSVLAEKDSVPVIVFDEIDSGVSGRIAQAVGKKLHQLAESHQVICVTHLPQIASAGRHHFLVEKSIDRQQTRTRVRKLRAVERPEAIARLLGGETISETHLQSARELLEEAKSVEREA
jgi:DNA repair protein RecN (Recombination protein N)